MNVAQHPKESLEGLKGARLRREIAEIERRTFRLQVRKHHSLFLVRFTPHDDLIETLGLYAFDLESELESSWAALRASLDTVHQQYQENRKQAERIVDLITELRRVRPGRPTKRKAA